jgi:hypothetical protein
MGQMIVENGLMNGYQERAEAATNNGFREGIIYRRLSEPLLVSLLKISRRHRC